ncbi:hypothetical protein DFH11DRAFT_1874580 [Phellopilus nigrolimitatus]|nr:hypothetical protein DFH11DRAFT_1874580 [Phellopilus nigrolimitatus]
MASFSRLQLAAALLEYDNDPEDRDAPRKSAYDSAIFAHLRRANGNIHAAKEAGPRPDFLGVALPSDTGVPTEVDKEMTRRSKASIDMLHNPFGGDEEEEPEEELEVDLASWGLDSLINKEKANKPSKGAKGKAKSELPPNNRRASMSGIGARSEAGPMAHSRTMSMPLAEFGEGGAFLDANPNGRRNTFSSPTDFAEAGVLEKPMGRQRFSSHPLIENLPVRPPLHSLSSSFGDKRDTVPFPSSPPFVEPSDADGPSNARVNALLEGQGPPDESNIFTVPPPPASRASRFDPKSVAHSRTLSNATRLSAGPQLAYDDEKENYLAPRAPSRASALNVKTARERRLSTASFGTRDMLDDDYQSAYGEQEYAARERRYSRLDLMRPKVLVMPSPLQNTSAAPTSKPTREGFLDSTDGRPLPPGARASRMSMLGLSPAENVPVASNSFTPNPRLSLSTSQLLFRNNLMVDGQRDVTYNDIDGDLQRAAKEGEQVKLEFPDEPEKPVPALAPPLPTEEAKASRPPGKLFGRSLIDDLEARKAEMRGKQRVFRGDERPSMMDRGANKRSSTFIDPASLQRRLSGNPMNLSPTDTSLSKRNSRSGQPLLTIDDAGQLGVRNSRTLNTRSVFGVDTLWEREMEKLKKIEAQEEVYAEESKRQEEEQEAKMMKKKKRKSRGKGKELETKQDRSIELSPSPVSPNTSISPQQMVTSTSLSLPNIPTVTSRRRIVPVPGDDDSDFESSASEAAPRPSASFSPLDEAADKWVSDDEKKPVRVSGVGLGIPPKHLAAPADDSDEDVPLSVTLQRASQKLAVPRAGPDDSDEDRPLSTLLDKSRLSIPAIDFDNLASPRPDPLSRNVEDEDEDNVPLGIRASQLPAGASQLSRLSSLSLEGRNADDDDRPLSMHPGQVRKSQFQMFAQVQQQQLFQVQMANSMAFAPPPSMMLMMPPPVPFSTQPQPQPPLQMQEPNKFSSVDRWRHDVAVEGQV